MLSTQVSTSLVTSKQEPSNVPDDSIVSAMPLDRSKDSGPFGSSSVPPLLPQLDRAQYKNITFWGPDEYQVYRKGGKRGGENILADKPTSSILSIYMEDENGNQIPEKKKKVVRNMAKGFFEELLKNGNAPGTWGNATLSIRHTFINTLETEFYFLRFCEGHWKANQIATNHYSQWYQHAIEREAAAKAKRTSKRTADEIGDHEVIDIDVDVDIDANENDIEKASRRSGDYEGNVPGPSKRPRVEVPRPTPTISRPRPTRIKSTGKKVCKSLYFDYMRCQN
jgi:hypothetical protein